MLPAAMDRVLGEIIQRVVHPAHVPLEAEAQPAGVSRAADGGPRGRFLGEVHDAGVARVGLLVEHAQESDRVEVLAPALRIGNPFALAPRVIQIEHRGDRVDAQAVGMELAQPAFGAAEKEVAHLGAAEVKDVGSPVGLEPQARIEMLVERGAVEAREREIVGGEVARHPVEDHADTAAMEIVDEEAEVVGRAKTRGGREVAAHLVAP